MFKKFLFIISISFLIFSFFSATASAAVPIDPNLFPEGSATISGQKPTGQSAIGERYLQAARIDLTRRIVNFVLSIAAAVAIFFIINNSWFLIISAGREETVTQHKKGLTWAIVGLLLIILSYSIIRFVITIPFQADERAVPAESSGETEH